MNTTYKNEIKIALQFGSVLFVSYFLSIMVFLFLPKEKPQSSIVVESNLEYKSFDFQNAFGVNEVIKPSVVVAVKKVKKEVPPPPPPPPPVVIEQPIEVAPPPPPPPPPPLVLSINVVAIFDMGKGRGFVTINERGSRGTTILSAGENYKTMKLLKVFPKYALFFENDTEYKVELNSVAVAGQKTASQTQDQPKQTQVAKPQPAPVQVEKAPVEKIQQVGNKTVVTKDLLETYTKNSDKIWRDISIKENLVNGKIDGFTINKIRRGSNFEKLGIRSGDILLAINNTPLKSYDDAMNIYKKIGNMQSLNMKILRGNETMELGYEIK